MHIRWKISIGVVITLFLIYRLFTQHVNGVKEEKLWYLNNLKYDFIGKVDTVHRPNHILFHVIAGKFDKNREDELAGKLKYWGQLVLLIPRGESFELLNGLAKYQSGDSLYLNSDQNIVRIYRGKELLSESDLVRALRGRPF